MILPANFPLFQGGSARGGNDPPENSVLLFCSRERTRKVKLYCIIVWYYMICIVEVHSSTKQRRATKPLKKPSRLSLLSLFKRKRNHHPEQASAPLLTLNDSSNGDDVQVTVLLECLVAMLL